MKDEELFTIDVAGDTTGAYLNFSKFADLYLNLNPFYMYI